MSRIAVIGLALVAVLAVVAILVQLSGPASLHSPGKPPVAEPPAASSDYLPRSTKGAPAGARVVLRCERAEDGQDLSGVTVEVRGRGEREWRRVGTTDARGQAVVTVPEGSAWVRFSAEGRRDARLEVEPGRTPEPARLERDAVVLGRVLEQGTDAPLAGVLVLGWDNRERARTDEDGRFRIGGLGRMVVFDLVGTFHQRKRFGVQGLEPGETREATWRLRPGGRVCGRVVDHLGEPVAGAWVDTSWRIVVGAHIGRSYGARPRYVTDDEGRFVIGGAPVGEEVRVFAAIPDRCSGASKPLAIRVGESEEEIEVRLLPPCAVTLRLIADDGSDSGRLYCRPEAKPDDPWFPVRGGGKTLNSSGLSGREGRLELGGFVRGSFVIPLSVEGFIPVTLASEDILPAESEEHREVAVVLKRGLTISGWVRDAAGSPVGGARLSAELTETPEAWDLYRGHGVADEDGRFEITGLRAGTYRITVADRNRTELFQSPEVAAGTTDLVLTAPQVSSGIEGPLLDAAGAPLRHANLLAFRDSGTGPPGAGKDGVVWGNGENGVYRIDLSPGAWWLLPPGGPAVRVKVPEGRATGPTIVVAQDRAVRGTIRGPDGPLADALVLVAPFPLSDDTPYHFRTDVGFCRYGWTDEHGAYRVDGLGAGPVTVRAYHADWLPVRAKVEIADREQDTVADLTLAAGGWIDVEPVGPDALTFVARIFEPPPPDGREPHGWPDGEFHRWAWSRLHPGQGRGAPEREAAPGRSFAIGPYRPGTYEVTVRATFSIPGTDRRVELVRRATARIEFPGNVPLQIVFTREDVEAAREGK